jgi:hypothetical protein
VEAVIDQKLPVSQRMKTSYLALLRADSGFDSAWLLFELQWSRLPIKSFKGAGDHAR